MQTYISILRGINVSGHKMIKMDALRTLYEGLGFKNVRTYIQSGNVVFQSRKTSSSALEKRISEKILDAFSFDVQVIVKDFDEVESVVRHNPFVNERNEDSKSLHVTFLSAEANAYLADKIKEGNYGKDEFIAVNTTIYLFCPDGYGNTKLNNSFFENKLKVNATTRNWKTVNELLRMGKESGSN